MGWKINGYLHVEIGSKMMADQKGNEMASTLAVTGINRGDIFKAWW
ncbi:hypothetical protein Goari_012631 [Gossypium aridum]|uniref:Uncharacterized protein n=1 Tax=Gossypium aridum TaxID=34290 RepID=A0A7J8X0Z7_GOSAI|nr:hypothetical protein [Gossypium aridum]